MLEVVVDHRSRAPIIGSVAARILVKQSIEEMKRNLYATFDARAQILV
jgi:hypothetical protein